MSLALPGLAVVFFSLMAFWKPNPVLFMLTAGASMMTGLKWFDVYTTDIGLSISLMLIGYSFISFGFAYRFIFWSEPPPVFTREE